MLQRLERRDDVKGAVRKWQRKPVCQQHGRVWPALGGCLADRVRVQIYAGHKSRRLAQEGDSVARAACYVEHRHAVDGWQSVRVPRRMLAPVRQVTPCIDCIGFLESLSY